MQDKEKQMENEANFVKLQKRLAKLQKTNKKIGYLNKDVTFAIPFGFDKKSINLQNQK